MGLDVMYPHNFVERYSRFVHFTKCYPLAQNQVTCGVRSMWQKWERREIPTGFGLEIGLSRDRLSRGRPKWEDNIESDLAEREMRGESVDQIDQTQDKEKLCVLF
jgi:hypothetical protein